MVEWIYTFDRAVLEWIQQWMGNDFWDTVMPLITRLGDAGLIWILFGVLLLCTKKYRKFGIIMLLSLLIGTIFANAIIKPIVARPRPFITPPHPNLLIDPPSSYSFPSGHSLASFTGATVLCIANHKWAIPAFCLAFLIAFSRMYLYVHYLTDVLTGSILGVLFALLTVWCWKKIETQNHKNLT